MEWRIMTVNERTDSTKNADTDWKIKEYAQSIEESSTKSKVPTFPTDIVSKHKGTHLGGPWMYVIHLPMRFENLAMDISSS
jgi:hypothetical protein